MSILFYIFNSDNKNLYGKILKISNVKKLNTLDKLQITKLLQQYGTIKSFRTVIEFSINEIWLIEFIEDDTIEKIILIGLSDILRLYPTLHIGYTPL